MSEQQTTGTFFRLLLATYTGPLDARGWAKKYQARLEGKIRPRALGNKGALAFRMYILENRIPGGGILIGSLTEYATEADRDAATTAEGGSTFRMAELKAVECVPFYAGPALCFLSTDSSLHSVLS
jgi:hypothetical protein